MKRVAISLRIDVFPDRQETRDALDTRLVEFVIAGGGVPFLVPNGLTANHLLPAWLDAVRPQAIVLSGGNDLGGCPQRDATEQHLLDHARHNHLPLLGICRGMQMMVHSAGGSIKERAGHVRVRHRLSGEIGHEVNSFHRFSPTAAPEGYRVLAQSEDGGIEAICHATLPWEGWMWHPEREAPFCLEDLQRMKALLS